MRKPAILTTLATVSGLIALFSCAPAVPPAEPPTTGSSTATASAVPTHEAPAAQATNVLLAPWQGPYGGVPPLDRVTVPDIASGLEAAIKSALARVDAVAKDPAAPTFENTLLPLEKAEEELERVNTIFGIWESAMSTPEFQKVEGALNAKLSAYLDAVVQNSALFERIRVVYEARASLNDEQKRLAWHYYNRFAQQGAKLSASDKARLSEINQKLAALYTKFKQNQLADEEQGQVVIDSEKDLAGLSKSLVDGAAAEAARRGIQGKWVIANTRSSAEPFLTYADNRALREKVFRMWASRGDGNDAHDNNQVVRDILTERAKKAKLLGYPTYAHWHLADTMAKTPDNALKLMLDVWQPATAQVKRDVAEMQKLIDRARGGFKLQAWDFRYYAEKLRKAKYDLDLAEVKPYLQLEQVREAMFWVAGELYGFSFEPIAGVGVNHPEVRVYQVKRSGNPVGLWYFDPYARPGKNSGAWMNSYRPQHRLAGPVLPIVSNNCNYIKGAPGEPVTISWDDARTMFHEFGHALHGLNSNVTYPTLAGTATLRDFVEFPSQLHEAWLSTPEVMSRFLKNAKGETLPKALADKIARAHTFNRGFSTVEAQASAIVDMKLHLAGDAAVDPRAFERDTLASIGMPKEMIMRHRIPHFGHIFSSDGYAAGYYSYIWAEVLVHDAFEAFKEAKGPYDKVVAKRFHDEIMSIGNTRDPAEAYRRFRGRDATVDALLRDHGFPVPKAPATSKSPLDARR